MLQEASEKDWRREVVKSLAVGLISFSGKREFSHCILKAPYKKFDSGEEHGLSTAWEARICQFLMPDSTAVALGIHAPN